PWHPTSGCRREQRGRGSRAAASRCNSFPERRPRAWLPSRPSRARRAARGRSTPALAGAFAGPRGRLTRHLAGLLYPLREILDAFGTGGARTVDPALHRAQQFVRELAVAGEQIEIRLLGIVEALHAQECLAAILDGFGERRPERKRFLVRLQRRVVVPEL